MVNTKEVVQIAERRSWWSLGLLLIVAVLPLSPISLPTDLNIIITAVLTVYVGCWRSIKAHPPAESMSRKDAMTFPLIGSGVLLGLFLLFKFLPKELVNKFLTAYFVALGALATTVTFTPFVEPFFTEKLRQWSASLGHLRLPAWIQKEPVKLEATLPEIVCGALSMVFCCWYYAQKHWLANNVLGLAFSVQGIEFLSLGSVQTGVILLTGLFFYDIFWVFCTPVMVSVAKNFDAPIKLLFPRGVEPGSDKSPFSMLGLGDIVIPGIFVALLLRYDALHDMRPRYFYSAFASYALGLATTIAVMNVFQAAQPALLYIVPALLGGAVTYALWRREFTEVFTFSEAAEGEAEGGQNGAEGSKPIVQEIADEKTVKKTS